MRYVLLAIVVSVALAACGSSSAPKGKTAAVVRPGAPTGRYASTYPSDFASTFTSHCEQSRGSSAMCTCAVGDMENAVSYGSVVDGAVVLLANYGTHLTPDVPWFDHLQIRCKRSPPSAGSPPYLAPDALRFLAAPVAAEHVHACVKAIRVEISRSLATGHAYDPPACRGVHKSLYKGISPTA